MRWAGNLASGLVEGIKSGIAAAGDAVAGMAESVKNKFKGWLGIASPSRVFAGYGLNVAQGAALGIKAGEGEAAGAAVGLAKAAAIGWTPPELKVAPPERPDVSSLELPSEEIAARAGASPARLAAWGKNLFSGLFPLPDLSGKGAVRQAEPGWQPPKLLTAPDGPAKIAAAASGDRERGREPESRAPVNLTFSPNITIQGSATEKDVRGALAMTLPELERMIRRLMHDRERRAYV